MEVVCKSCRYRFDEIPGLDSSGPVSETVCPQCGSAVDVGLQIAEAASRTTAGDVPREDAPAGARPRTLGDYEILEEVSRGAMGVIYKARHKQLRRVVAMKVMIAGEHASAAQIARFEKEARAAAKLRHANIVPIYEIGAEGGNRFFTMDFIDGTPLDVLVARGELTPRDSLEIIAAVGEALAYAHAQGVIHRDIKPSNIMLDRSGRPQIMDFGLAKQMDSDSKFTRTGTTIGTPSYMAPEQARGENKNIDQRSDVYSLGAVLYEMLTGHPPFTGETMMNIVMKVIHDDPVPLRRAVPKMHRDIETIVSKAMEKEPRRRYQSMAELAGDIRRYLAGEMIAARPAGPFRRMGQALKKHRAAITAGLVIGILTAAVSGAIIHVLLRQRAEAKRKADLTELELLLRTAEQEPVWAEHFSDTFSGARLGPPWRPPGKEWRVENGRLAVDAKGETQILLPDQIEGNTVIEFTASAASANSRINCFLGPSRRSAYTLRFGSGQGNSLSLYRLGKLLAEVRSSPIKPGKSYRFRIEWRGTSLVCRVSGGGNTSELRYDDPVLLRGPGPSFGFYTWGCAISFDDLRISREEFPGQRLNKLQAIDSYVLAKGKLTEALDAYEAIIANHGGQLIAVLAEHKRGLVKEALGQDPRTGWASALEYYRNVERKSALLDEKHRAVLAKNKERIFFLLARMGRYEQAAKELAELCGGGGTVDAGCVWQFPAVLSRCVGDRAYGPALNVMEKVRFSGPHRTLRAQWAIAGPAAQNAFGKVANDICGAFAGRKSYDEMKRAFVALPDPRAVAAFEAAVNREVSRGDPPSALGLLMFATERGMATAQFERAAALLAQHFIASKQYGRIVNVHTAYPARSLVAAFDRAVSGLAGAGDLPGAIEFFDKACGRFPKSHDKLRPSADLLMAALLKSQQFADVARVHAMIGDPRLAGRLVQAAQGQLDAKDLAGAHATLEYIRVNVPARKRDLLPLAADLATKLVVANQLRRAVDLFEKYPSGRMAEPLAVVLATASRADDRPLLRRLMIQVIVNFQSEPRAVAAARSAARTLISAEAGGSVLAIYESAAALKAGDHKAATSIRLDAAQILLAGRSYAHAATAFAYAANTPAVAAKTAASALVKAAAIWQHLGNTDRAERVWNRIGEDYPAATAQVKIAELMAGSLGPDMFAEWLSANPKALIPGEANFYLALEAAALGRQKTATELFRSAIADGKDGWFRGIAEAELRRPFPPWPDLGPEDEE